MSAKKDAQEYKVICPLINFTIQIVPTGHPEFSHEEILQYSRRRQQELVEGIELYNGMKLRCVSKEDIEDLKTDSFLAPPHKAISPDMFVLEKYISSEDSDFSEIHNIMLNGVLALRLLKSGNVRGRSLFHILLSEKRQLTARSFEREPKFEFPGGAYILSFEDIPSLRKTLQKIQNIDRVKRKNLDLVFKRFQRTYDEGEDEDKLIDLMIAFEALFLRGMKGNEKIGQKIASACSKLLGKNNDEIEEIGYFLRKAYSLRSSVVHGNEFRQPIVLKGEEFWLEEFVLRLEDYLREAIKKSLDWQA